MKSYPTQRPGFALKGVKNCVAIASGKGGVGKSTVSLNLALALQRKGFRVGVLDADIYGPSLPSLLGITTAHPELDAQGKYHPIMAHGLQTMSIGFLTKTIEDALIWRGPMLSKALMQLIDATQWDNLDMLLIDLPPGTGDIQLSLVQKIPLAGAVIITTPQQIATLDAHKAICLFKKTNIVCLGLIENMSIYQCAQCGHQTHIFGEEGAQALCEKHHIPLLGQLPLYSAIGQHNDAGLPIMCSDEPMNEEIQNKIMHIADQMMIQFEK